MAGSKKVSGYTGYSANIGVGASPSPVDTHGYVTYSLYDIKIVGEKIYE